MKCPNCDFDNRDDARFCKNCGQPLTGKKECPNCKGEIDSDSKFCEFCGSSLEESQISPSQNNGAPRQEKSEGKERAHRILSKVLSVATLVFFALSLLLSLVGGYLSNVDMVASGSANVVTFFSILGRFFASGDSNTFSGQIHNIVGPYQGIYLILVTLFFYGSVIALSILGIVKQAQNLSDKAIDGKNPYLLPLLAATSLSYVLMANGYALGGNVVSLGTGTGAIIIFGGILFVLRLACRLVFSFQKGKGLELASNIVTGVFFIQFLVTLTSAASGYVYFNQSFSGVSSGAYGFVSILSYLESVLGNSASADKINFALSFSLIISVAECLVFVAVAVLSYFAIRSVFKEGLSKKTFIFPAVSLALAFAYLTLAIVEAIVLGTPDIVDVSLNLNVCSGPISLLIQSFFFLGGSIACYILKKKADAASKE